MLHHESLPDDKPFYGGGEGGEAGYVPPAAAQFPTQENPYTPDPVPPQAAPLPTKQLPNDVPAPPYSEQLPPSHTALPTHNPLPYVSPPSSHGSTPHVSSSIQPSGAPTTGVQPPPLPSAPVAGLDLPPVPTSGFPNASTASDTGGEVDFDDLTRRFEELKRRR